MATPPTFSSGAILTAAQMNSVGLWLVKSQTVGTAVSSVTVTGAFSADYDAYKIIWTGGTVSTSAAIGLQLRTAGGSTSTTAYYGGMPYVTYAGVGAAASDTNAAQFTFAGGGDNAAFGQIDLTLLNPFLAKYTNISSSVVTGSYGGQYNGVHTVATSYSDFVLDPFSTATMTGGTIRVYGYRN
jgi:hypothetical protein